MSDYTPTRMRPLPRLAIASAAVVAALAFAATASAHSNGPWLYPLSVQSAIQDSTGYQAMCQGRGAVHYTSSSTWNPQTWKFRHFQCLLVDYSRPGQQLAVGNLCIHTRPGGGFSRSGLIGPGSSCRFAS
jgi:hypothetical protein